MRVINVALDTKWDWKIFRHGRCTAFSSERNTISCFSEDNCTDHNADVEHSHQIKKISFSTKSIRSKRKCKVTAESEHN